MQSNPSVLAQAATRIVAGAALLLGAGPATAAALAQGGEGSREQATLIDEQVRLARKLDRLRAQMGVLAERFDGEGRAHAARLLRRATEELELRNAEGQAMTLPEIMEATRGDLASGRPMTALERQDLAVKRLERLLDILLDRQPLESLEKALEELRAIETALADLADEEGRLQERTEELRQQSANDAQRALEEGIRELREAQRALLEQNERAGRESGVLELEAIERDLEALIERQEVDVEVLESWRPDQRAALEELRAPLERARAGEQRAERLEAAAQELERAAQEARAAAPEQSLERTAERLAEAARREQRHQRASGSEAAAEAARALSESAQEMQSAQAGAEREAAAQRAEQRAAALRERAAAERNSAAGAREAARRLAEPLASERSAAGLIAAEVAEQLERAGGQEPGATAPAEPATSPAPGEQPDSQEARAATEEAGRRLERGIDAMQRMGAGLALSQDQARREAEALAGRLGQARARGAPGAEQSRQELGDAAQSMGEAAEAAQGESSEAAATSAQEALDSLRRAALALAGAKSAAEQPGGATDADGQQTGAEARAGGQGDTSSQAGEPSSGGSAASQQQAQGQAQLAERAGELSQETERAALGEQARAATSEALERGRRAMERAAQSLEEGERSEAAGAQREALDALAEAEREASRGVTPQGEEGMARAQELAREQQRIREQLLALARRLEESQAASPPQSLGSAQASAGEAQESLAQGDLDSASEQEEETERAIREAIRDLEEEERQYQELRQEELLFKITEEVAGMLESHRVQMQATAEVDAGRRSEGRDSASRADRLRLRNIAREEEAVAQRAGSVVEAILKEGARVFAEVLSNVQTDLLEVARRLGEGGGYRSDEGVQALQGEIEDALLLLLDSLKNELERRQRQSPPGGTPPPPGELALVPDVAELKVLRTLEVGILHSVDELLLLHPELAGKEVDDLLLRDLSRLAYRHQRVTELFQDLRRRLGLSDPPPQAEDSEHP